MYTVCLFELHYYGSKLIIVFHRIRTPELELFNFVRIIKMITVVLIYEHLLQKV